MGTFFLKFEYEMSLKENINLIRRYYELDIFPIKSKEGHQNFVRLSIHVALLKG
jgi:hypothetical protein